MRRSLLMAGATGFLALAGCGDKEEGVAPVDAGATPGGGGTAPAEPVVSAPADTVEGLLDAVDEQFENLSRALKGAKTSNAPEKFSEIVGLVSAEMKSIAARLQHLEAPPNEVKEQFAERMAAREKDMERTFGNLEIYLSGLAPEAQKGVRDALGKFMVTMGEVQPVFSTYFTVEQAAEPPIPPPDPPQ